MKWLIASDLHGSAYYVRQLLKAIERESPDRILLLGDVLYHGPRNDLPRDYSPKEVIAMLNPLKGKIFNVRGNCDTEVDQQVLNFPILADYILLEAGKRLVFATHGHRYDVENIPSLNEGDIVLQGHTHIPMNKKIGKYYWLNPGSISIPKAGSPHSYMTLEENYMLWKSLEDGDIYDKLNLD